MPRIGRENGGTPDDHSQSRPIVFAHFDGSVRRQIHSAEARPIRANDRVVDPDAVEGQKVRAVHRGLHPPPHKR